VDGENSVLNQDPVLLDQTYTQTTDNITYGASLSYTEPLGNRKYLEANYSIRQNKNDVNRKAYNMVNDDHELMDSLSNVYNSEYLYQRGGVNFRMNKENYSLTMGAGYQQTLLDGEIIRPTDQAAIIDRTFSNFLPSLHFNYDFDNNVRLRADYETNMQAPTIQQLQPTRDVNSFPNIYEGNPNLKPSYQHSLRLNFSKFNPVSFVSFFAFVNGTYTSDAITNSQSYNSTDSVRVTITTPINVDNNVSLSGNANMSFPLSKLLSRLNIGINARGQQSINVSRELVDEELQSSTEATINQLTLGGNIRYTFTYKEIFDLSIAANLSHQKTQYEGTDTQDQKYFNRTYTTEGNFSFLKYYRLSGTLNYRQYETQAANSAISIPMLNFSLSRYFLKANAGELKFMAVNVLDKSLGVTQTANVNYFERQTMNNLGRYYMVTFTYAINKHLNPMGGNRGGGRRMMIMN